MNFSQISRKIGIAVILDSIVGGRSLDDVSVGEICMAAQISRSTFYRTYNSIYEIPAWCQDLFFLAGLHDVGRTYTWRDGLYISLSGLDLFINMYHACAPMEGYQSTKEVARRRYRKLIPATMDKKGVEFTDRLKFQLDFYAEMETHYLGHWINAEVREPFDQVADDLASCVPSELRESIDIRRSIQPVKAIELSTLTAVAQRYDPFEYFVS